MKSKHYEIGVGATEELNLRVSVGVLVSVLFTHPEDGQTMLVLERTATLRQTDGDAHVIVQSKPFGGAVQIIDPKALESMIGYFHYDSERSRREKDFRIQVRPAAWEIIIDICHKNLNETQKTILDSSPDRELAEEFQDTLSLKITPDRYQLKRRGIVLENQPSETDNVRVERLPTMRLYYLFDAWIESAEIIEVIFASHNTYSDKDLQERAWQDAQQGGKGRANAIFVIALDELKNVYHSVSAEICSESISVDGHQLDGNVLAILEDIETPKYQHYSS